MDLNTVFSYHNIELELVIEDKELWHRLSQGKSDKNLGALMEAFVICLAEFLKEKKINNFCMVSCYFSSGEKIKLLNSKYRSINKDTDVLSFPLHENLFLCEESGPLCLGDIYISLDKAHAQSIEFDIDFLSELIHLSVHGLLHLMGYDHEISEKEQQIMEDLEQRFIGRIKEIYAEV